MVNAVTIVKESKYRWLIFKQQLGKCQKEIPARVNARAGTLVLNKKCALKGEEAHVRKITRRI